MFTIVMGNQDLSVIWKILKILNILMSTLYLMFPPLILETFSDYEGNESFAEGVDKSNNDLSHTVNVDIPLYQVQKMNVNHLKYKLSKRENLCVVQKHSQ